MELLVETIFCCSFQNAHYIGKLVITNGKVLKKRKRVKIFDSIEEKIILKFLSKIIFFVFKFIFYLTNRVVLSKIKQKKIENTGV